MAYNNIDRRSEQNLKQDDMLASKRFVVERKPDTVNFYELEDAVVLDVVMDENSPALKDSTLDVESWPPNIDDTEPEFTEKDYSWIGRIRFRFLNSQVNEEKTVLNWAYPLENTGIVEYPLMNEIVIVGKYLDRYFYTRKLNTNSTVNSNALFSAEKNAGQVTSNINSFDSSGNYDGPESKMNFSGGEDYTGILGSYFKFNPKIRGLKLYEGDTLLQSRFGSSIRFGAYDANRNNDDGLGEYEDKGGNPMMLIRNRQAPIKLPQGNNAKGYTLEDINKDGSSIHITSGKTTSEFKTTIKKVIFSADKPEEQPKYSPNGATSFKYPKQDGDQIVINSDRLIFSSKANETFHFSKKRYAVATDDEYTVDAHKQIVLTTNEKTTINSPFIFLGQFEQDAEPVLLGRTTTAWDMALCNWLLLQTNWMIELCEEWLAKHVHDIDSRKDVQTPPRKDWQEKMKKHVDELKFLRNSLIELRDRAPKNMSQRVFTVGGGGASGFPGGELKEDSSLDAIQKENENEEKKAERAEKEKKYKIELIYTGGGDKSVIDDTYA